VVRRSQVVDLPLSYQSRRGKRGGIVPPPLRSWSLRRCFGRVATVPYPPPRPCSIVEPERADGNDLSGSLRQSHLFAGFLPSFSRGFQFLIACLEDHLLATGQLVRRFYVARSHCAAVLRCNGAHSPPRADKRPPEKAVCQGGCTRISPTGVSAQSCRCFADSMRTFSHESSRKSE
jgi:hypothetical protein